MRRWLDRWVAWSEHWVPDPFLLAIVLSVLAFGMAVAWTPSPGSQLVAAWYRGFWELLAFAMQMTLILVTGYVLAQSPPVHGFLRTLARWPRNGGQAVFLCGLLAGFTALIHWGLGLMVGALVARQTGLELRRRGVAVHYPLLGAAGYLGLALWHGGLSGSAPLLIATRGHFLADTIGVIPIQRTILTPMNLLVSALALAVLPVLLALLHPPASRVRDVTFFIAPGDTAAVAPSTVAPKGVERLETIRGVPLLLGALGLGATVYVHVSGPGRGIDLNSVIAVFLFLSLALHRSVRAFLDAFYESARAAGPIILQFPFYGGILGLMKYTGLAEVLAGGLTRWAGTATLPLWIFLSAGLINFFVPSGGGQWAVQGPVAVAASLRLGVPVERTVMAVAYGDQWTNLLQPFWALPLLGVTGLRARDIMGYGMILFWVHGIIYAVGLSLLPLA